MTDTALQSQIAAARAYEGFFVPALFQEWAPRVIDAAQLQRGDRVLDVACGTGVLAREAAARLGSAHSVAGVDPNLGMLTVAARAAPDIEWREGIAEFGSEGVASIAVATHRGTARFPSIRSMLEADRRGWLPLVGVVLTEDQIRRVLEAGEMEFDCCLSAEGTLAFEVLAHIVTGVRQ